MSMQILVITVHGIRTFGGWQERLEALTRAAIGSRGHEISFKHKRYGYFSVLKFLNPLARNAEARRFSSELANLLGDGVGARFDRICLVGHSFGTHIIAYALQSLPPEIHSKVDTVIFSGSVLNKQFRWDAMLGTRVVRVVNDCGDNDWILPLNAILPFGSGVAGRNGFEGLIDADFCNRYFAFGHSGYFYRSKGAKTSNDNWFMARYWVPLLIEHGPIELVDERTQTPLSGLTVSFVDRTERLKWVPPVIAFTLLLMLAWQWQSIKRGQRDADRLHYLQLAAKSKELLASGDGRAAALLALEALPADPRTTPALVVEDAVQALRHAAAAPLERLRLTIPPGLPIDRANNPTSEGETTTVEFVGGGSTLLVIGANGQFSVLDAISGKVLDSGPLSHNGRDSTAVSSDGTQLAILRDDGDAEIISLSTNVVSQEIPCKSSHVISVFASTSGGGFGFLCEGGSMIEGAVETKLALSPNLLESRTVQHFAVQDRRVAWLTLNNKIVEAGDPETVVASGPIDGTISLFQSIEAKTFQKLIADSKSNLILLDLGNQIIEIDASDDAGSEKWTVHRLGESKLVNGASLPAAAFSPDGVTLAVADNDGGVRLFETRSGSAYALLRGHKLVVSDIAFSADGHTLVTGADDGTVRLWSLPALRPTIYLQKEPRTGLMEAVVSSDGRTVAANFEQAGIFVWQLPSGTLLDKYSETTRGRRGHANVSAPEVIALSPDGKTLAALRDENIVELRSTSNLRRLDASVNTEDKSVWAVAVGNQGQLSILAHGQDHGLYLINGQKDQKLVARAENISGASLDGSGKHAILIGPRGYAKIVNLSTMTPDSEIEFDPDPDGGYNWVSGRRVANSDASIVAIARSDLSMGVWKSATRSIYGFVHPGDAVYFPIMFDGNRILFIAPFEDCCLAPHSIWAGEVLPQNPAALRRMVEELRLCPLSIEERRHFALDDAQPTLKDGTAVKVTVCGGPFSQR
jgi:WD40 repeat protein